MIVASIMLIVALLLAVFGIQQMQADIRDLEMRVEKLEKQESVK